MTDALLPLEVLIKKRDGHELSRAEIETFVRAVVRSGQGQDEGAGLQPGASVSDAQIASFLMAVFQRGLSPQELADLTQAMRFSGEVFDASDLQAFTVDKHSTGGVGDKTSLLIAPIVAAAGLVEAARPVIVPMISGRSLGHTGGTLDKLESIPGFNTQLSLRRMKEVLRSCGATMAGQTQRLVPADRILYALRDHTGTVESPALITASIMSKKLAEDLRGLVLDVKVGSGAFLPTYAAAQHLADLLVKTGERAGTRTIALLTSMDEPLGRFAGNWVEVWECVDILRGDRHPMSADVVELSCALAGWMLHLAGHSTTPEGGARLAYELLSSGAALKSWLRLVETQGGDTRVFDHPDASHRPGAQAVVRAPRAAYLAGMNCREVGWAVQHLGAGRAHPGDPVSAHAGLEVHAKVGTRLDADAPVFTLFADTKAQLAEPLRRIAESLRWSEAPPVRQTLIREVIGA